MIEKRTRSWPGSIHAASKLLGIAALLLLAGAFGIAAWLRAGDPSAPSIGVSQTIQSGGLSVTMQLDDTALGQRLIDVQIHDPAGQLVGADSLQLRFSMSEMDMDSIEAAAQPVGRGHFQARGAFFSMAGRWAIEAIVGRPDLPPVSAVFTFPIAAPGEASGPLNPLAADQPTQAAGRLLYQANCAACHGPTGKGDGPAALALRPRPADFAQHMALGKHTDGQIYLWIKNGYPNSAMPAWGQRLGEQQIWQLVTYLRSFAQPATGDLAPELAQPTGAPDRSPSPTQGAQPAAAPIAPEPLPPLIFTRAGNLWRSDGSARAPQQLTRLSSGSYAEYPVISPRGDQIAFIVTSQGPLGPEDWPQFNPETKLAIMRSDGSDLRVLWDPERGVLGQPVWTPDGRAVAVAFADLLSAPDAPVSDRLFQIMRVDPESKARTVALQDAYDLWYSHDGQTIAFLRWSKDHAAFSLNIAAADGSRERELVATGAFSGFSAPRFSPDGRRLLFVATGGPATDQQGQPIARQKQPLLAALLQQLAPPAAEAHGLLMDMWIINTDGTNLHRVPGLREDSAMAVFAPDGAQIAAIGAGGIYLMNADGTNVRKIDPIGDHGGLDWAAQ